MTGPAAELLSNVEWMLMDENYHSLLKERARQFPICNDRAFEEPHTE